MPTLENEELENLLALGKGNELLEKSKELIFENRHNTWAYFYAAMAQCLNKEYQKAYNMMLIALEKEEEEPKFHSAFAEILLKLGETKEAAIEFEKAIEYGPDNGFSWFFYGQYLYQCNPEDPRAIEYMEKATTLLPDHTEMVMALAKVYNSKCKYTEVKTLCREVLIQEENHPEANYLYGKRLMEEGMFGAALEYVSRAYVADMKNTAYEKAFFQVYKQFHPNKSTFWNTVLLSRKWYFQILMCVMFLGTFFFFEEYLEISAVLFAIFLASLGMSQLFYKRFKEEYSLHFETE